MAKLCVRVAKRNEGRVCFNILYLLLIFHIFSSRIYWCSAFNGGHRIEEARLDGKHRRTLLDNLGAVTSLTLDYENKWIYFADKLVHTIERVDFGGKNRKKLLSDVAYPQALTLYSNSIYFGDWKTRSVGRADKNTGQNRTRIMDNLEYVMDLLTYHKSRQTGMFYKSFLKNILSSVFINTTVRVRQNNPCLKRHCSLCINSWTSADWQIISSNG